MQKYSTGGKLLLKLGLAFLMILAGEMLYYAREMLRYFEDTLDSNYANLSAFLLVGAIYIMWFVVTTYRDKIRCLDE